MDHHRLRAIAGWLLILSSLRALAADNLASLCGDRTAIERVYYEHRIGNKPSFQQVLPPPAIERLVKNDLRKEAVLKKVYGVEITPAQVEAEAQRIDATTRAPEMLMELKAVLGNDPARFARSVAKPLVVERELRARFENDERLHVSQRQQAEDVRDEILAAQRTNAPTDRLVAMLKKTKDGSFNEVTWHLTPRVGGEGVSRAPALAPSRQFSSSSKARGGPYTIEATAQLGQVISAPENSPTDHKFYFEDLSSELQNVLYAQLQKPTDISAVIETSNGFLLFALKEKSATTLTVVSLSVPKRSYEEWLARQSIER